MRKGSVSTRGPPSEVVEQPQNGGYPLRARGSRYLVPSTTRWIPKSLHAVPPLPSNDSNYQVSMTTVLITYPPGEQHFARYRLSPSEWCTSP